MLTRAKLTVASFLVLVTLIGAACAPAAAPTPTPTKAPPTPTPAPKPKAEAPPKPAVPAKPVKLSLGTGGTAGVYYPLGGAMSKVWGEADPSISVTVEATGGSVENARLLDRKQIDIALAQNDVSHYAYNGTEFFKEKAIKVLGIASIYPEYVQFVVDADSPIKAVADLKGKRYSPGPPGSGCEANARQIFEVAGLTYKDLAGGSANLLSVAEQASAFKDRQLDAVSCTGGLPFPAYQDIAVLRSIRLVPIGGELRNKLMEKYGFYIPVSIPASTYRGQTEAVDTVAVLAILVARPDLEEDTVYRLTKILIEKQPELAKAHAKGKDFTKETALRGISIPFHPGAEKYYKEIGLKK